MKRFSIGKKWGVNTISGICRCFFVPFLCLALIIMLPVEVSEQTPSYNNALAAVHRGKTHKEVRVGYVETPYFMQGMSDDSLKSGMAYDYIQKVSYYANWHCKYVYGDWDTILQKLYNGEVDIMAGVSKTPERQEKLLFPDYAMGSENYHLFCNVNNPLVAKGIDGIKGITVSVNSNTIMVDMLQQWNADGNRGINIRTYSGNEDRYRDFKAGLADATVDTDNAIKPEDQVIPIAKIGQSDYYLAVNKQRPDLLDDLNYALVKINSTYPSFTIKLSNTYFSGLAVLAQLQHEELIWLNEHPVISVGYVDDYLPLSDTDENGKTIGIVKDVLHEMFAKLHIQDKVLFSYVPFNSYEDMIDALKDGRIDLAFPTNYDVAQAERDDIYLTSEVINVQMYLIYAGEYAELNLRRMAAKRNNSIGDIYIKEHFPDVELIYYDDINSMLDAVKNGKVDGCVLNQFRKDSFLLRPSYSELQTIMLKDSLGRCFGVSCGNSELLSILNRGITNLPNEFGLNSSYAYTGQIAPMTFKDFMLKHVVLFTLIVGSLSAIISGLVAYIYFIRRNRERMDYMAHYDSLTTLLNRNSFEKIVDSSENQSVEGNMIVVAMDLNGLKAANDNIGHDAGDELLQGAAACMTKVLMPYGQVFRTGGDEFMAILNLDPEKWPDVLQRLKDAFNNWTGKKVEHLSVSIGVVMSSEAEYLTLNKMITMADHKMYEDKSEYYRRSGIDRRKNR